MPEYAGRESRLGGGGGEGEGEGQQVADADQGHVIGGEASWKGKAWDPRVCKPP